MPNLLQDQLLKAGLVKKSKVAQVAREQAKQRKSERKGKGNKPSAVHAEQLEAQRLHAEKVERDRALAAERNAQRQLDEALTQARQIVQAHKLEADGEIAYRFADADKIRDLLVNAAQRAQLVEGALVIVRHADGYALLPRSAADKIRDRAPALIVLDHGHPEAGGDNTADDADAAYYEQFEVPDDLIW